MKKILYFFIFLILLASGAGYYVYNLANTKSLLFSESSKSIEITEPISFADLGAFLEEKNLIANKNSVDVIIKVKQLEKLVLTEGRITLKKQWTNNQLVNQLKLMRNQKKIVSVIFGSVRNLESLAGKIAPFIELDSTTLINTFKNPEIQKKYGFNNQTFLTLFIPNTYDVYFNITAEDFVTKMAKEYKVFWNAERIAKAKQLNLSQSEVTILASIVYEEQKVKFDEQAKIAGLYLNRLKNNWMLQADPTVKFALGDPTLKRLLYKHLEVDSPYNTYKHTGLPPGPIALPEPRTIDAVLNYKKHDYFYMCAKPEYSGYHNFSKTLAQHNAFAKKYQRWLTKEGIR